jgi:tRNA-modifying protein YgfZ
MFSHEQYDALQARSGLLDRRRRGRILLTGADRRSYLQGLLTNDILALGPRGGCYAALLTPQGRMISDMRVSELGGMVLIDLPASTAGPVRQRLADFVFSEDVDVQDAATRFAHLAVYGPTAPDVLAAVLTQGAAPADAATREALGAMPVNAVEPLAFQDAPVFVVPSDDYGVAGFELFAGPDAADRLAAACREAGAVDVSAETVDVTRVEAGVPEFGPDMDEHTIPLEAGIEDRAISLTKGCYVGQEIIIRVLHRGHGRVARRLVGLVAPGEAPLDRDDRLHHDGRDVGVVTSAVVSPRLGRPIALAYVHRDHTAPGTVLHAGGEGASRAVTVASLPFGPPAPEASATPA